MKPKQNIVMAVVIGIVILESIALMNGVNGILLTATIGILAALGGLVSPQLKIKA